MSAALARALAAQAAAAVQTTAFRRRALQVAVQSAAKRFRRGFIPSQLNLPALAGKPLSILTLIRADRSNVNVTNLLKYITDSDFTCDTVPTTPDISVKLFWVCKTDEYI